MTWRTRTKRVIQVEANAVIMTARTQIALECYSRFIAAANVLPNDDP